MYNATATPQPPRCAGGAPRAKAERALPARGRGEPAEAPGQEGQQGALRGRDTPRHHTRATYNPRAQVLKKGKGTRGATGDGSGRWGGGLCGRIRFTID